MIWNVLTAGNGQRMGNEAVGRFILGKTSVPASQLLRRVSYDCPSLHVVIPAALVVRAAIWLGDLWTLRLLCVM